MFNSTAQIVQGIGSKFAGFDLNGGLNEFSDVIGETIISINPVLDEQVGSYELVLKLKDSKNEPHS